MASKQDFSEDRLEGAGEPRGKLRVSDPGRTGCIVRWLVAVVVLLAIFMVTLAVVVRMDGGRDFLRRWLERELGMELTVENTHMGLPYVLVMENVVSSDYVENASGFRADQIRIGLGCKPLLRVTAHRADLVLVETRSDEWEPKTFLRLADLPRRSIAEVSRVTEGWGKRMTLTITESRLQWLPSGAEPVQLGRFSFRMRPARVAGTPMQYYFLSGANFVGIDGVRILDVEREWLASDENGYIEITRAGSPIPAQAVAFWEPAAVKATGNSRKPGRKGQGGQ